MTDYTEMIKRLRACAEGDCRHYLRIAGEACVAPLLREAADAIEAQQTEIEAVWKELTPRLLEEQWCELNLYDQEDIHEDCTVIIWRNSVTGEESVGWYENNKEEYKNV